jgi:hypothetical protein
VALKVATLCDLQFTSIEFCIHYEDLMDNSFFNLFATRSPERMTSSTLAFHEEFCKNPPQILVSEKFELNNVNKMCTPTQS